MPKKLISTTKAPRASNAYSQAIEANGFVFVAGQIPMTVEGELIDASIEGKLDIIIDNLTAILHEAGLKLDDVVKTTVYLTDLSELAQFNEAYSCYFSQPLPARETVCVKELPLGATMEISVIAAKS